MVLYLDDRYLTAAREQIPSSSLLQIQSLPVDPFQLAKTELNISKVGVDGATVNWRQLQRLQKTYSTVLDVDISHLRQVKTPTEIKRMRSACSLAEQALVTTLLQLKLGMTEKHVRTLFIRALLALGAEGESFSTIVASGVNGAVPHARASEKKLTEHELITIDFGCYSEGYASDTTRTFCIGQQLDPRLTNIFRVVARAQKRGIAAIKPGVTTGTIDAICRDYIHEAGYGKYFTHSTGHGIGIDVHEPPWVKVRGDVRLETGMIITVEPGIYLPGIGGVRIEDQVLVTSRGYQLLTTLPRYAQDFMPLTLDQLRKHGRSSGFRATAS